MFEASFARPHLQSFQREMSPFVFGRIIPALLASTFLVVLGYCIWALPRGFDITDESYFLLLAIYPDVFKAFVSGAQWITSPLWSVTGSLSGFRAIGLGTIIFGGLTLALGAIRAANSCGLPIAAGRGSYVAIISTTLVVALHWNSYGVSVFFTPSYNLIATAAGYSTIGFTLLCIDRKSVGHAAAFHILAGAGLGIVLLCKFPAGVSILVLTLALIWAFSRSLRELAFGISTTFIGAVTVIFVIVSAHMTPVAALEEFKTGLSLYTVALPEAPIARLMRNAGELLTHWSLTATQFAWPIVLFGAYALSGSRIVAFFGFASLIFILVSGEYMLGGYPRLTLQLTSLVAFLPLFF